MTAVCAAVLSGSGGAFGGANGQIAFATDRDGNSEIYLVPQGGGTASNRTLDASSDRNPAWSPDGTKIAFTSDRTAATDQIFVMGATSGAATSLTSGAAADQAAWSPSGAKIAFTRSNEIFTMNADGSGQTNITNNVATDQDPAWSPDGTKIAFSSDRSGNFELYAMNSDGTGVVRLTNSLGTDKEPAWSPDGTRIAFTSARDGNDEIYIMNADTSAQLRLTNNAFPDSSPSWSPDGTRIAFASNDSNAEIYTMNPDGTQLVRLTTNAANDTSPDWGTNLANTVTPAAPSGTARDGSTLTASPGTWSGVTPINFAYSWQRCNSSGASCSSIGASSLTYTLVSADVGSTIRVVVTATNTDGSTSALSAATAVIGVLGPTNSALPTISGTSMSGQVLSASTGTWVGTTPLAFTYQWKHCDSGGNGCTDIGGAVNSTYIAASADEGGTLRVAVTASNSAGSAAALSPPSALLATPIPANTVLPTTSGTTLVFQTLIATTGTWTGLTPLAYSYQWQRCDSSGASCSPITGATSSSYSLVVTDIGSTIRVAVRATNASGSTQVVSLQTLVVSAAAPVSTTSPSVSGTPAVGNALKATNGTWTGTAPITYTYQWKRCDSFGLTCVSIAGATSSTYTVADADGGSTLLVAVTAQNAGGVVTALSDATDVVASKPANTIVPAITGTPVETQSLFAAKGTWTGGGTITYSYEWRRCDASGANCSAIAAATDSTYTVVTADIGSTIRVAVTATNESGTATSVSAATAVVASAAPANITAPSVTGTPFVASTLSASSGKWSGAPVLTYTYQWERCDASGATCTAIAGETDNSYDVVAADNGQRLRVTVTATNASGSASKASGMTDAVIPAPAGPVLAVAPAITGTPSVGQTLTASNGTWTSSGNITYAYAWARCKTPDTCTTIPAATHDTYTVVSADVGFQIRATVTATDSSGSISASSELTDAATKSSRPLSTAKPKVTGLARVGRVLVAAHGKWASGSALRFLLHWQRCTAQGTKCKTIKNAKSARYKLSAADRGAKIRVSVTASSSQGSATATSAPVGPVGPAAAKKPVAKKKKPAAKK